MAFSLIKKIRALMAVIKGVHGSENYIENPLSYLQKSFPDRAFSLKACECVGGVEPYYIKEHNGCAMYGIAALLKFHDKKGRGFDEILGGVLSLSGFSPNYYLGITKYRAFTKICLNRFSIPGKVRANWNVFSPWSGGRREIDAGRPFLLNLVSAGAEQIERCCYVDHTVTCYGYRVYTDEKGREYSFFQVRDGYTRYDTPRFVYTGMISFSNLTIVK